MAAALSSASAESENRLTKAVYQTSAPVGRGGRPPFKESDQCDDIVGRKTGITRSEAPASRPSSIMESIVSGRQLGPVVDLLRTELQALAASSGRTPTATEAFLLVRRQKLSRADLEAVLEMLQHEPPPLAVPERQHPPPDSVETHRTARAASPSEAEPEPASTQPETSEFDDWELFSSAGDPDDAREPVSDDAVARVLDDLVDDWRRTDGVLTRDQVQLLSARR